MKNTELKNPDEIIADLKAQREIYKAHLAWIDSVIASAPDGPTAGKARTAPERSHSLGNAVEAATAIATIMNGKARRATMLQVELGKRGISMTTKAVEDVLASDGRFRPEGRGWWKLVKKHESEASS